MNFLPFILFLITSSDSILILRRLTSSFDALLINIIVKLYEFSFNSLIIASNFDSSEIIEKIEARKSSEIKSVEIFSNAISLAGRALEMDLILMTTLLLERILSINASMGMVPL